jgi:cyanate lyase
MLAATGGSRAPHGDRRVSLLSYVDAPDWEGFYEADPKGDRVKVIMSGKFLPYKTY